MGVIKDTLQRRTRLDTDGTGANIVEVTGNADILPLPLRLREVVAALAISGLFWKVVLAHASLSPGLGDVEAMLEGLCRWLRKPLGAVADGESHYP